MNRLTALLYFVLALFGIDTGGSTLVHRSHVDGVDTLHSKATVQSGVARFECLRSASGRCHYIVMPDGCTAAPAPGRNDTAGCSTSAPIARFALGDGDSRQITGLQRFRLCVHTSPDAPGCEAPERLAAR